MTKNINYVSHKKSRVKNANGTPQLPSPSSLVEGELAINYAKDVETLSIKNESGSVVTFSSDDYYTNKKLGYLFSGDTTVSEVIKEDEEILALSLNDLNERKLDTSAYTETVGKLGETIHYLTGVTGAAGAKNRSASWSGNCDEITELYTGLNVQIVLPNDGHASGVILSINGGEKHPIMINGNKKLTTQYGVGSLLNLVYNADKTSTYYSGSSTAVSVTGCWDCEGEYNTNTDTIGYSIGTNAVIQKTDATTYRYMLLLKKDEETFTPVNTTNNTTAGTKTLTTSEFDPFGDIIYKNSTATIGSGEIIPTGTTWTQVNTNLSYSFNTTNTLVPSKSVYIVAVPLPNGKAKLHTSPITQTLPTTEDGLIYIYLGQASSATNVFLMNNHPIYEYKFGGIQKYVGNGLANELSKMSETIAAALNFLNKALEEKTKTIAVSLNDLDARINALTTLVNNSNA